MQKLLPRDLIRPGFCLLGALRDEEGRVLIPAGTCLDETHIAKLGRRIITGLYSGNDWPDDTVEEIPEPDNRNQSGSPGESKGTLIEPETSDVSNEADKTTVKVDSLHVGMHLSQNIYDQDDVLLLAAGSRISSRFLDLLRQRGIQTVRVQRSQPPQIADVSETTKCKQLDELISAELNRLEPLGSRGPVKRPQLPHTALWDEARRGLERHVRTSAVLANASDALRAGKTISGDEMGALVEEFSVMLTLDCDLLTTIVSMQETSGEYLFDHCVNVSLLSMAIAAQLGMNRQKILEIGLGGIFHDVGMMRVPDKIRLAPRALTSGEWNEIERHPIYTLEYLEQIQQLPITALFIGYQVHERIDRSGYPRGRSGTFLHPFAKIVAVADAYSAMTSPRPYRSPIQPHEAVRQILVEGSLDKFDRMIIRAFLDSVSTLPIGSSVELSNGVTGKVVRANPGAHTRPIIAEVDSQGAPTDQVIDLRKETRIKVVRVL